jgi:FAD/FMN-containing dehydrogenase
MQVHARDGNVHTHIMKTDRAGRPIKNLEEIKKKIYNVAVTLGQSITAEYGIWEIRISDLNHYIGENAIEIMKKIKIYLTSTIFLIQEK